MPKGGLGKGLGDLGRQADPFSAGSLGSTGALFRPQGDERLTIDGVEYRFIPDLIDGARPSARAGRHGTVYHVTDGIHHRAMKVFRPEHRAAAAGSLAVHSLALILPGLSACQRTLLSPPGHDLLLRQCPGLQWSALMPWVDGPTWGDVLRDRRPLSPGDSLALAKGLAGALSQLEQHGLAHGHLSADNIILPSFACPRKDGIRHPVELVDLEHLYLPGQAGPEHATDWAPSYAHRVPCRPVDGPRSDRFAGVLVIAEMLGWCDEKVREASYGAGGYFEPSEMQTDCRRAHVLLEALSGRWGGSVAEAFTIAWESRSLNDCPTLGEWLLILPATADRGAVGGCRVTKAASRTQPPGNSAIAGRSWLMHAAAVIIIAGVVGLPLALWFRGGTESTFSSKPAVLSRLSQQDAQTADMRVNTPAKPAASGTPARPALSRSGTESPVAKTASVVRGLGGAVGGGGRTARAGLMPNRPDGGVESSAFSVHGKVVDREGRGIAGVTIKVSSGYLSVVSNESGEWRLVGLKGTVSVVPTKDGWVFTPVVTRVSGPADVTIVGRMAENRGTAAPASGSAFPDTQSNFVTTSAHPLSLETPAPGSGTSHREFSLTAGILER